MKKHLKNILFMASTLLLAGCVVIINNGQPSPEEKQLIAIQNQSSQEVVQTNQKIQSGGYSVDEIKQLITQTQTAIQENIKKIEELHLPERAKALADTTKQYLEKAKQTYDSLSRIGGATAEKAKELLNNVKMMSQPLLNMAQQMTQAQLQFIQQIQAAAQSS